MSANLEAQVASMVLTDAVRDQLHEALDHICDNLAEQGQLGATVKFTLTPSDNKPGEGDELSVTLQILLVPLFDSQPCGYFIAPELGEKVVTH